MHFLMTETLLLFSEVLQMIDLRMQCSKKIVGLKKNSNSVAASVQDAIYIQHCECCMSAFISKREYIQNGTKLRKGILQVI